MAGLWERVKRNASDRVPVHFVVGGLKGYASGLFTANQILNALDGHVASALTTAERNDITAIAAKLDTLILPLDKLVYLVGKLEPMMIAAESGDVNETKWRSDLGI